MKLGVAAFVRWAYRSKTAQTSATPTHAAMLGLRVVAFEPLQARRSLCPFRRQSLRCVLLRVGKVRKLQMNVEKLRQSIEKNNAASIVRVMPFAVGSSDREVTMQIDSISNSGNGEVPRDHTAR